MLSIQPSAFSAVRGRLSCPCLLGVNACSYSYSLEQKSRNRLRCTLKENQPSGRSSAFHSQRLVPRRTNLSRCEGLGGNFRESERFDRSFMPREPRRMLLKTLGGGILGILLIGGGMMAFPFSGFAAKAKASEAEDILVKADFPEAWPFKPENFERYDETADTSFYNAPRFVTHIDDAAIKALSQFYGQAFPPSNTPGVAILDMCSSWISHYPKGYQQGRIAGLGLNKEELARNPVLTEFVVHDLNVDPSLPYEDNSFDVITNAVSVDYLSKPLEVFKEMHRVLKPGGLAIMSFSNRCFWTKAIQIWTATGDTDHCYIVGCYFHYSGGFERPQAKDISPNPGRTDPMYVVYARKLANGAEAQKSSSA
eukprot:TRINITY_DN5530_c1_g4_i1.p1 TRINITY_DN5530_c1_g4~~TRINITY_DN5530_c1_g4_i1.p1  ORF type:complete len:367 (+),score=40.85 TRINITY_DN5530_c1_g4_i1:89-1189(+)